MLLAYSILVTLLCLWLAVKSKAQLAILPPIQLDYLAWYEIASQEWERGEVLDRPLLVYTTAALPSNLRSGGLDFIYHDSGKYLIAAADVADLDKYFQEIKLVDPAGYCLRKPLQELIVYSQQAYSVAKKKGVPYLEWDADVAKQAISKEFTVVDPALKVMLSLAQAIDLRDPDTAEHSKNVAHYAQAIAHQLELEPYDVELIRTAGYLHDVGKIGIPDSILRKPSPLNDQEYQRMKLHTEIGAGLLSDIGGTQVRAWILFHHECWDGSGYPHQLEAEAIPLGARIIAIADSYEAMTADRVYRKAPGHDYAVSQLQKGRGTQYDPALVDIFLDFLQRSDKDE